MLIPPFFKYFYFKSHGGNIFEIYTKIQNSREFEITILGISFHLIISLISDSITIFYGLEIQNYTHLEKVTTHVLTKEKLFFYVTCCFRFPAYFF